MTDTVKPADLLMWVGAQFYPTPQDFIAEAIAQGVSKRIPINNPPENIVPGISRLFFVHPQACVRTKDGKDFAAFKQSLPTASLRSQLDDWERNPAFYFRRVLEGAETNRRVDEFVREYLPLEFCPGIFAFCYITGMQYVCKPGETQPPDHLRTHGVEPVVVEYEPSEIHASTLSEEGAE